jgi:hypothetical protein
LQAFNARRMAMRSDFQSKPGLSRKCPIEALETEN